MCPCSKRSIHMVSPCALPPIRGALVPCFLVALVGWRMDLGEWRPDIVAGFDAVPEASASEDVSSPDDADPGQPAGVAAVGNDAGAARAAGPDAQLRAADILAAFDDLPYQERRMSRQDAAKNARRTQAKKRKREQKQSTNKKFNKLSDAWDLLHGLRNGDHVSRSGETGGKHRNAWTLQGLLRLGFRGVGRHAEGSGNKVGETTHTLAALTATHAIADAAEEQALRQQLTLALGDPDLGLVINWHHDATRGSAGSDRCRA